MDLNIAEDLETPANVDLSQVAKTAGEMLRLEAEIEAMEAELKDKKKELETVQMQTLPDLMQSFGLKDFTLSNGAKVVIDSIVKASLPTKTAIDKADEDERPVLENRLHEALTFMRDNNAGELIKNELALEFSKGQDNIVGDFIGKAEEMGIPHKRQESVHNSTLCKWIKERMQAGLDVPMDLFGVYTGKKAIVKLPSKRRKKS